MPKSLIEAATALGLRPGPIRPAIVAPLAIRNASPAYGNEMLIMIKATSLVSMIILPDINGIAYRVIVESCRVSKVFIAAAALHLAINAAVGEALRRLEVSMYPEMLRARVRRDAASRRTAPSSLRPTCGQGRS